MKMGMRMRMRMNNLKKKKIVKNANIKELIEEPKEIKSLNWLDKNKFKEILAIIDSNEFHYKNKIGEFKYIDIKDLVDNIRNNTISEIDATKGLNTLNEIKNAKIIKYKKRTPGHKKLLNLFDDLLDIILTDKTLESESQEDKNENDKTLMSSEDENQNENGNENENKNENDKNENAKNKNTSINTKKDENENEDENKNILLEDMGETDDKLLRKYSNGKNFSSFINDFDRAINEEDKEKVVKELKKYKNILIMTLIDF